MTALMTALATGFTSKQIVDYLIRQFPNHKNTIENAIKSGFTPDQVVKYLAKGKKGLTEEELGTEFGQTLQSEEKRNKSMVNTGLGIGAAGLGLGTAALAAPSIGSAISGAIPAIQRSIPRALQPTAQAMLGTQQNAQIMENAGNSDISPMQSLPQAKQELPVENKQPIIQDISLNNPSQQPPVNQVAPNIAKATESVQPEGISNPKEYLEKLGLLDQVNSSLSRGNSSEQVAAEIGIKRSGKSRIDPELVSAIENYAKENPTATTNQITKPTESIDKPEIEEVKPVKIEKGSIASSPHGAGEILEVRNGKALIDVDGKKFQVNEDELEKPDFSEDEIADAYDNYMSKIPEEHKSGFIQWAGYDEDRNTLGFIPRGGKYEELHNITPEEAKRIKEGKGVARTTGETREGLWVSGEDTRGGIISQIIWDRKKAKEVQEKKQGKFDFNLPKSDKQDHGIKPIFDENEYARNLSRERDKKKKLEERARLKKEKEDAKKRKK